MRMPKPLTIVGTLLVIAIILGFAYMAKRQAKDNEPPPPPVLSETEKNAIVTDDAWVIIRFHGGRSHSVVKRVIDRVVDNREVTPAERRAMEIKLTDLWPAQALEFAVILLDHYRRATRLEANTITKMINESGSMPGGKSQLATAESYVSYFIENYYRAHPEQFTKQVYLSLVGTKRKERQLRHEFLNKVMILVDFEDPWVKRKFNRH